MKKDELIIFLKENLKLEIIDRGCYDDSSRQINIKLKLENEIISEDWFIIKY